MRQVASRLRLAERTLDDAMAQAARRGLFDTLSAEQAQSVLDTIDRMLRNLALLRRRLTPMSFGEPSPTVLYESTLLASGKTTVPKAVREALRLRPGDKLLWSFTADGTVFVRVKRVRPPRLSPKSR